MNKLALISLLALLAVPLSGQAGEANDADELKQFLLKSLPGHQPDSVKPSPIPGLFEVSYGADVFYSTKDGQYMLRGDLYNVFQGQNLSEAKRSAGRLAEIDAFGEDKMIVFAPQQVKHTLTVFYDIDCPFCRKMQNDIPELNKRGIKVRYLAFPRTGLNSVSYQRAVSVWCAEDRHAALAKAENDQLLEEKTCANPVKQSFDLGNRFKIGGTPTLILGNGEMFNGYKSVDELVQLLEQPVAPNPLSGP